MKPLNIEYIKVEEIIQDENNPKIHTDEQIDLIKKSIEKYGFKIPLALSENNIIRKGHGSYRAALLLDYKELPCIRGDDLTEKQPSILKIFIDTAHKHNAKIHGLGFTQTTLLHHLNFDSVDSTSWLSAGRFGIIYRFNGSSLSMKAHKTDSYSRRVKDRKDADLYNLSEWVKFQKYAEMHL